MQNCSDNEPLRPSTESLLLKARETMVRAAELVAASHRTIERSQRLSESSKGAAAADLTHEIAPRSD
jgi:hypothetical protein